MAGFAKPAIILFSKSLETSFRFQEIQVYAGFVNNRAYERVFRFYETK